jgi:hypothetical protein
MSPSDARKADKQETVKRSLSNRATFTRVYSKVEVCDLVRIYKKKKGKLDKQQTIFWSDNRYKVEELVQKNKNNFYKTPWGDGKLLLRHEICKYLAKKYIYFCIRISVMTEILTNFQNYQIQSNVVAGKTVVAGCGGCQLHWGISW